MGENKNVRLADLLVWSDNPRISNSRVENENAAISLIYEIVGSDKMDKLAEDIDEHGLHANKMPIVVLADESGKYEVYDGNRRISILKLFASNDERINKFSNKQKFSLDTNILVHITTKQDALRMMEIDHSGENNGVGQIAWKAFERDNALEKLGRQCMYPLAREVSKICDLRQKKHFRKIPYTDLNSIYNSRIIKSIFDIDSWDFNDTKFIKTTYNAFVACKPSNKPYSRYLKDLSDNQALDKFKEKIENFMNTPEQQNVLRISCARTSFFPHEIFSTSWLTVKLNAKQINISECEISYEHIESSKIHTDIQQNLSGVWKIVAKKDNLIASTNIQLNNYKQPSIMFKDPNNTPIHTNNTFHFTEFLLQSIDSLGNNCIDDIVITFDGEASTDAEIDLNNKHVIFRTIGYLNVMAHFIDPHSRMECSKNQIFDVKMHPLIVKPISDDSNPFFIRRITNSEVNFNNLISKIILQIENLYVNKNYHEVIVASLRSVLESICEMITTNSPELNNNDFATKVINIYGKCKETSFMQYVASNDLSNIGYKDLKNSINLYSNDDIKSLVSLLHLGAHKSSKYITYFDLDNKRAILSFIIELFYFYNEFKNQTS